MEWKRIENHLTFLPPGSTVWRKYKFVAIISREGLQEFWHLSISHANRYPVWDEIKAARYELIPDHVTMCMILPPKAEYVNLQENTFHLHEIRNGMVMK